MEAELNFLIVEDDPVDAYSVRRILTRTGLGQQVDSVPSLDLAKQKIGRSHYDAVILDLGLPDSQGIDGIIDFQSTAPELPIIVLSGSEDEKTALRCIGIGAEEFINKGRLSEENLVRCVRYAIERHRRKWQIFRDMDLLRVSLSEALSRAALVPPGLDPQQPFSEAQLVQQLKSTRPFAVAGIPAHYLVFGMPTAALALSRARAADRLSEMTLHGIRMASDWRVREAPGSTLHLDVEADAIKPWVVPELNRIFKSDEERSRCVLFFHADFSSQPGAVSLANLSLLKDSGFQIGARNVGDGATVMENLQRLAPQWIRVDASLTINVSRYKEKAEQLKQTVQMLRPLGAKLIADETEGDEDLGQLLEFGFVAYTSGALAAKALDQGVQKNGHAAGPLAQKP